MPLRRDGIGGHSAADPCPDPDMLCAVLDGESADGVPDALAEHIARCPSCGALRRRLESFHQGRQEEWSKAEKRLDRWLADLAVQEAPRKPSRLLSWRLPWVLVPAMAALLAAIFFITRSPSHPPDRIAVIPPAEVVPQPAANPKTRDSFEQDLTDKMAQALRAGPPPVRTPATAPPVETATAGPVDSPTASSGPVHPLPAGAILTARTTPPGMGTATTPDFVRVAAGTRLWIFLKSLDKRSDTTFDFRGVVLLPVTQKGKVVLDRETEVNGVGSVSQGKTSVRIQQFGSHGAHYRLTAASSGGPDRGSGAGGSLQFDAGQVLEMWVPSASTYERVP